MQSQKLPDSDVENLKTLAKKSLVMGRRKFLKATAQGAIGATAVGLVGGCNTPAPTGAWDSDNF